MKTSVTVPTKIASTPDQKNLLESLIVDTKLLNQFVMFDDGIERAEKYAISSFQTEYGDEMENLHKYQQSLEVEEAETVQSLIKQDEDLETLERKLELSDEEKAKPTMSITTIVVQTALALTIAALLGVGAHNFATLLIKHGEPFLSKPLMAYVTAFSAAAILAIILKALISIPKRDSLQRLCAGVFLCIGLLSAIYYLAILSHMIKPEFAAPTMENVLSGLSLDSDTAATEQIDSYWENEGSKWFLLSQFIAEAAGAAGIGYFFARNLKAHRSVYLRNNPIYMEAMKTREDTAALLKSIRATIAHCVGYIRVLESVCVQHMERCVSHVQASKQLLNMATHFSGLNHKG